MAKLNYIIYLNAYSDKRASNAPNRQNFKWERAVNGIPCENPNSYEFSLAPGETRTLLNGIRSLTQDGTTQYSIAPQILNTDSYVLSWVGGTNPTFRTSRTSGADTTTQVTVTTNGTVVTYTSTGGTPFSLISSGVVVGDYVRIGSLFNVNNQGLADWKIISLTSTSFSVVNQAGVAEGPFTLGAGFATQIDLYSAAGVQVGDTLQISSGFSPVTQGSYTITSVSDKFLIFASLAILPTEGPITTEIAVYSEAQQLVYLESDQYTTMTINGLSVPGITPMAGSLNSCNPCAPGFNNTGSPSGQYAGPGIFLTMSIVYSMTVTNASTNPATLYFASVEKG